MLTAILLLTAAEQEIAPPGKGVKRRRIDGNEATEDPFRQVVNRLLVGSYTL
jgi:hypothetical protein